MWRAFAGSSIVQIYHGDSATHLLDTTTTLDCTLARDMGGPSACCGSRPSWRRDPCEIKGGALGLRVQLDGSSAVVPLTK